MGNSRSGRAPSGGKSANAGSATYKPRDVEELVDFHIHRPVARSLVRVLAKTPITSNQVTVASAILGIAAGFCAGFAGPGSLWLMTLAGVLLFTSVIFDCSDGQLARLRGTSSLAGHALDGAVDAFPIAAMYIGTVIYCDSVGINPYYVWPLATAAGLSLRWHAETYDFAKGLYLANTAEGQTEALPSLEAIEAERQRVLASGQRVMAFFLTLFAQYSKVQRKKRKGQVGLDSPAMQTDEARAIYRRVFRRHMRWWSWNGIGIHHFLMVVACLVTPLYPPALLITYWVIVLGGNALAIALLMEAPRLEKRLAEALASQPETPSAG
ncbi:MAG: phosphatidylglycerophosphate synthase [Myxococcota bacterium]|jgi:phosphatidylglycerophosphate synthase